MAVRGSCHGVLPAYHVHPVKGDAALGWTGASLLVQKGTYRAGNISRAGCSALKREESKGRWWDSAVNMSHKHRIEKEPLGTQRSPSTVYNQSINK